MTPLFLLGTVALILLACTYFVLAREERQFRAATEQLTRSLAAHNLTLTGEPDKAYEIHGELHGVRVTLKNHTTIALPGASGRKVDGCLLEFDTAIPDQIVCLRSEVDAVMGPLPTIRRLESINPELDKLYTAFVADGGPVVERGFRDSAQNGPLGWPSELTARFLSSLDLGWLRVLEGRCQIALAPVAAPIVFLALVGALNLDRTARGLPPISSTEALPTMPEHTRPVRSWLKGGWIVAVLQSPFAAMLIGWSDWFCKLDSSFICGPGGSLLAKTLQNRGKTSLRLYCAGNQIAPVELHYLNAAMLWIAVVVGGALIAALITQMRARQGRRVAS